MDIRKLIHINFNAIMIECRNAGLLRYSFGGLTLFLLIMLSKNVFEMGNRTIGLEPDFSLEISENKMLDPSDQSITLDYRQKMTDLQEANEKMRKQLSFDMFLIILLIVVLCVIGISFYKMSAYKQKEKSKNARLQVFLRKKYEMSKQYVADNESVIASLTRQLNNASEMIKQKDLAYMELQKKNLQIKNAEHELVNARFSTSLALIRQSECGMRFSKAATDKRVSLTKSDWQKLSDLVLTEFPLLMQKLEMNSAINNTEKKVVLLTLLNLGTLEMSTLMELKNSTISSAKKTVYEKLSGMEGSAKDLSQEIINIVAM